MVATEGVLPVLIAEKAPMFPVPLPASPMLVLLLVQLKAVAVPVKFTAVVLAASQTTWFEGAVTVGVGCTVIVKFCGVPLHVTAPKVYFGVTVIVAMTGTVPALFAVKAAMFPEPVASNPIEGVSLVQS
jgi:hypothetical protein